MAPKRKYLLVLDELWQALRAGHGMVDRLDSLTRLNRAWGIGMAMASHTMSDLTSLSEEDRDKAIGLVERSGMVVAAGLPRREMPMLNLANQLSSAEETMLASWIAPAQWDPKTGRQGQRPGVGKFLIKVGGRPGIPVQVQLTPKEFKLHNTNALWAHGQENTDGD